MVLFVDDLLSMVERIGRGLFHRRFLHIYAQPSFIPRQYTANQLPIIPPSYLSPFNQTFPAAAAIAAATHTHSLFYIHVSARVPSCVLFLSRAGSFTPRNPG